MSVTSVSGKSWRIRENLSPTARKIFDTWLMLGMDCGVLEECETNDEPLQPKSELFKAALKEYSFESLPKVKCLSKTNRGKIVDLMLRGTVPYQIAMLDYLEFFIHLQTEYFKTKGERNKKMCRVFGISERQFRGLIDSLSKGTKDIRYTANGHKTKVKCDYEKIKNWSTPL